MNLLWEYLELFVGAAGMWYYLDSREWKKKYHNLIQNQKHLAKQLVLARRYNKLLFTKLDPNTQVTEEEIDNLYKDL